MSEEKELYTYKELSELWGISLQQIANRASEKKIPRIRSKGFIYIKKADALEFKKMFRKFAEPGLRVKKIYWRLSIFDPNIKRFVVKKCSMTHEEAMDEELKAQLNGFITRIAPCA